jgi:ABC-2 type transport system ATP-binding protein
MLWAGLPWSLEVFMSEFALKVRGLRKRYPKVLAVDGLDLEVMRGEVFGLLGPNGAGKTTTLEIIEGITPRDAGDIEILGMSWDHHGREIRSRIGVQLQSTSLFNKITPKEALELYGSYYPKSRTAGELLELVQLTEKAGAYHVTLSGGQQQRLAIALALVNDPELVFLDEPTTGLDPQARRSLWDVVRHIKSEGRTVILTTHYMEEAETLCDRLAIMDQGRALCSGSPLELIQELKIPSVVELAFDGRSPDPSEFARTLGQTVEARGDLWEIPTQDPKSMLSRLLECAESAQVPFQQVHVRRATLEDVFLHRTGRSLRD